MSSELPAIDAKELIRILHKKGFVQVRQSGSHAIFRHSDGRRTTVPIHGKFDFGKGLLKQIMKESDISTDDIRNR